MTAWAATLLVYGPPASATPTASIPIVGPSPSISNNTAPTWTFQLPADSTTTQPGTPDTSSSSYTSAATATATIVVTHRGSCFVGTGAPTPGSYTSCTTPTSTADEYSYTPTLTADGPYTFHVQDVETTTTTTTSYYADGTTSVSSPPPSIATGSDVAFGTTYTLDRSVGMTWTTQPTGPSTSLTPTWTFDPGAATTTTCALTPTVSGFANGAICGGTVSPTLPGDGSYTLAVTGTDALGNVQTLTSLAYQVVPPGAPGVSVTTPGNSTAVDWTLVPPAGATAMSAILTSPTNATNGPIALAGSDTTVHTDLSTATQGDWVLSVTATVSGRTTAAGSATYTLDTTKPVLTVGSTNAATPTQPSWTVGIDDPAIAQCAVTGTTAGGAAYSSGTAACGATYTSAVLAQGSYTLTVTAIDAAGNAAVPVTRAYTYDITPPVAPTVTSSVASSPTVPSNNPAPVWTISGEAGGTFTCTWTSNNLAPLPASGPCASGYDPTLPSTDDTYTLSVTQTDASGNTGPATPSAYYYDGSAPVTTFTAQPTSPDKSTTVSWTTSVNETSAKTECRLVHRTVSGDQVVYDWRTAGNCGRTVTETLTAGDGTYLLQVRDTDAAGNVNANGATATGYVLDTTGPGAPTVVGTQGFGQSPNVSWTITPTTGDTTAYSCRLVKNNAGPDPTAWAGCTSPFTADLTSSGDGTYRLDVVASDALGNNSAPVTSSADYVYDTTKPTAPSFTGTNSSGNTPSHTWTWTQGESAPAVTATCQLYTWDGTTRAAVGTGGACTSPHTELLDATAGTTYLLAVTLTDQAGNHVEADGPTYLLDTVAPTAPVVHGPTGTGSAKAASYAFTTGEGGGTVQCQLMQRPTNSTTWSVVQTSGNCVSPWNVTLPAVDGDYTTQVTQTDAVGNTSAYGESETYTLDVTGPVAPAFTSGPTGTANAKDVTWTWSAEAASTATCAVTHGGTVIVAPVACNAGTYSTHLGDGDGVYTVTVQLTDQYGNVGGSTTSTPYTLDATAPGAPTVNGPSVTSNDKTAVYSIAGPVEPGATAECRLTRDGTTTVSDWASCTLPRTLTLGVDGSYVLEVRLTDQYGNVGAPGASPAYLLDTTAPVVTALPATQSTQAGPAGWTVSVTGGPAATCQLTSPVLVSADGYDNPSPCSGFSSISLPRKGTYTLTASSTDAAGNTGTATATAIYRDAPTVTVTPNKPTGNTTAVTWTVGATAGTTLACTLAGPGDPVHAVPCSTGPNATTVSSTEGTSTFTATATDPQTGFTGTASATYVYDVTPPAAFTVTGTSGDRNTTTVDWAWTATDATSSCQLRKNGAASGGPVSPCLTDWTTAVSGEGTWQLDVTLTDAAGNSTTASSPQVRVDLTPPAAPGVSTPKTLSNDLAPVWTLTGEAGATFTCSWTDDNGTTPPTSGACATGYAPTLPATDGIYTLRVVQTDLAGNTGSPQTVAYTLDLTAPVVTFTAEPTSPGNSTTVSWTTSVSETSAQTECRLIKRTNGADLVVYDWRTLSCGRTVTATLVDGDGTYELQVRDTDPAGNVDPAGTASPPYALDTTGPGTPTVAGPAGWHNNPVVTWTIGAPADPEVPAGYDCRLVKDGTPAPGSWVRCDSQTFTTTLTVEATYRLDVVSLDALGNASAPITSSADYLFDPNPPAAAVFSGTASTGNATTHDWTWSEGEPNLTADCRLLTIDGGTRTLVSTMLGCTSAQTEVLAATTPGTTYVLEVTLTDRAGNSTAADGPSYLLDTVAPVAPSVSGPSGTNSVRAASYTFVPSEPGAVAVCNLMQRPTNSTTWTSVQTSGNCVSPWNVTLPAVDGDYATRVTLTDAAGNTSAYGESQTYTLDLTGPVAPTFTAGPTGTANVRPVTWTWTYEPLSTGACTLTHAGTVLVAGIACNSGTYGTTLSDGDGAYTLTVRLTDQYGNVGGTTTSATYTLDTTPPGAPAVSGPSTTSNVTTASYAIVGPVEPGATAECRLERDGSVVSDWASCTLPTTRSLSGDGSYVLKVRLTDQYGNLGAAGSSPAYLLDTTLPTVPAVTPPSSPSHDPSPVFTFVIDGDTTASCQLSRGSTIVAAAPSCAGSFTGSLGGLADGDYVLTVASKDAAGNVSTGASAPYTYDTTAPSAPVVTGPAGPSQTRNPAFGFTSEAGARAECATQAKDGGTGPWTPCQSPYAPSLGSDGTWTLLVRLTDAANNVSAVGASGGYILDTTAPSAPSVTAPASPGRDLAPSWSAETEAGSRTECRFTGPGQPDAAFTACSMPMSTPISVDGTYVLEVRAIDQAGNVSPAGSGTYVLDTTAPPAPVVSQPTAPGRGRTPSLSFTAEAGTTASCRVTRGTLVVVDTGPCTSPVQLNLADLPDGAYTLTVRAVDAAGNTGPAATGTYVLDTTAPASPTFTLVAGSPSSDRAPMFAFNAESGAVPSCRLTTPGGLVKDLACASPVTLDLSNSADGSYSLAVTARDAAGNTSVPASADFTLDSTAPGAPRVVAQQSTPGSSRTPSWRVTSASPAQCRVLRGTTTFKDWGPCATTPTGDFALDLYSQPDAVYLLEARVVGTNAATSSRYRLDTTGPGAATITSPPSPSTGRKPAWTIASSEPAVTADCRVTVFGSVLKDWARCDVSAAGSLFSYDLTGLGDGTYTLSVRLTDNAGNPGSAVATSDYVLDTSAPAAVGVDAPATPGRSTAPTWTLKSSSGAKLECRLSSKQVVLKDFSTCSGTFVASLGSQPDGFYTLTVHALSAAGTPGPDTTSTYELDQTPPAPPSGLMTGEKKTSNNRSPRWTFLPSPGTETTTCEVSYNGSVTSPGAVPCTSPYTMDLTNALDGSYLLKVVAVDKAGNPSSPATATYTLRTQPAPTPEFIQEPGSPSSTLTPTWVWSTAYDVTSQCRTWYDGAVLDSGDWTSCKTPDQMILGGKPDGVYKLQVRVVDIAGNPSKPIDSYYTLNRSAGPLTVFRDWPTSPGHDPNPSWTIAPPDAGTATAPALMRATALAGTECLMTVTLDAFSAAPRVGSWTACSGTYTPGTIGDGTYVLGVRTVDATGTIGPTSTSTYRLDTKRPDPLRFTSTPPVAGNEANPLWSWADDPQVQVQCHFLRNNVAMPTPPCSSSFTDDVSKSGQANYTLEATVVDRAGNPSEPTTSSYRYDTTAPPAPVFTARPSSRGTSSPVTWTFTVPADATAVCVLTHDNDVTDQRGCDGTYTTSRLTMTGVWQLSVHFVDTAGNVGPPTVGSYTLTTYVPAPGGGDGTSTGSGPATQPSGGGGTAPSRPAPAGPDTFLGPLAGHPLLNAIVHPVDTVKKTVQKVLHDMPIPPGLSAGIHVPDAIKNVLGTTITRPQLPLALFVIVVLFLLVQNRIDRRDPKLAAAPVEAEPELEFGPRVRFGATGGATA